jgi:hypothetical protein
MRAEEIDQEPNLERTGESIQQSVIRDGETKCRSDHVSMALLGEAPSE